MAKSTSSNLTWFGRVRQLLTEELFPAVTGNIYIYGPPRTGKSSLVRRLLANRRAVTVTMSPTMSREDFSGGLLIRGGDTVPYYAGASRAMIDGAPLIVDEIDQFSPDVETLLLSALDPPALAQFTGPDGSTIIPRPGYGIVATANVSPDALPERLRERFGVWILADQPCDELLGALPPDCAAALANAEREVVSQVSRPTTTVSFLTFARLRETLGAEQAATIVWGDGGELVLSALETSRAPS